jgi:hypothetical protein
MYKGKLFIDQFDESFEINIGSAYNPRMIKIGKNTTPNDRRNIEDLIREYKDALAWSYDDLKSYKRYIVQHTIPLKEGAQPFIQTKKYI